MRTIDAAPTWEGILPALLAVIESGTTAEARNTAMTELRLQAHKNKRYDHECVKRLKPNASCGARVSHTKP
jgi:hypothetical protein